MVLIIVRTLLWTFIYLDGETMNVQTILAEKPFGENPFQIPRKGWKNNRQIREVLIVMVEGGKEAEGF